MEDEETTKGETQDYYAIAHTITEEVTAQPTILCGYIERISIEGIGVAGFIVQ
jgi:hypothetical protein